jgi:hypothetical protein
VSSSYTYNPNTWPPVLAGAVAGSIGAIVSALVSLPLRSPEEVIANSLTVVLLAIVLGLLAGGLWRRLRATANADKTFIWSMVGAFFAVAAAVALVDLFFLSDIGKYAAPLVIITFITLGFFVPMLSRVTAPVWVAAIPIIIALALGVGLFGRGNVASGELSLDDIDNSSVRTTEVAADDTGGSSSTNAATGAIALPGDLAASYVVTSGVATYSV